MTNSNTARIPEQTVVAPTWPMLRALAGVGIFCSLVIVFTYQVTLPIIEANKAEALGRAVFNVLPGAESRQTFRLTGDGSFTPAQSPAPGDPVVYAGYDAANTLVGIAIEARGQGFQDIIRIIYGYAPDREAVIGIQVLESKETPGLGDKIETDPEFLQNFDALDVALTADGESMGHPIEPVKKGAKSNPWEIECITGATISSKAISAILRESTARWIPPVKSNTEQFKGPAK